MKKFVLIALACLTVICLIIAILVYEGIILINNPSEAEYSVRGIDVSRYQGNIDWAVLAGQNIDFAFIKATEGASHIDECFEYNYREAQKTSLRIGAYHFFSFESGGRAQADHFISTVPKAEDMLPPVIDLEFYGDFAKNRPDEEAVVRELTAMVDALYSHYGVMPIIYTAEEEYSLYVSQGFKDCAIWMRSVYKKPSPLPDGRPLTFWQYTNRERLDGYDGDERFIDMNLFFGSEEEFERFGRAK